MLINIECSIVQSLKVSLTFDNNRTKEREIAIGDLCSFVFHKDGMKREIEGKVIKIGMNNTANTKSWYIIVDGSLDYAGQQVRFCPDNILDCDVIKRHDEKQYISTPNDETRVTNIRLNNGFLQVSIDGGYSYMTPKNFKVPVNNTGEEIDVCPGCGKPTKKPVIVEPVEDGDEEILPEVH